MSNTPAILIVMPVKNEARYLRDTLTMVFRQQIDREFEVIVIDSGSTDGTLDILADFPVRLVTIPPHEFGHGRTRNMALDLAAGEMIVFLNGDATPADDRWLYHLVKHFRTCDRLAGVYSKHIPREDCDPLMKRELLLSPAFSSPITQLSFISDLDAYRRRPTRDPSRLPHFVTVSGAVSRAVLAAYPLLQDIEFAEDWEWGIRVVEAGYGIMFEPESAVIHSHNIYESAVQTLRKSFDAYTVTVTLLGQPRSIWKQRFFFRWCVAVLQDVKAILSQERRSLLFTLRWLIRIPFIRAVERVGGALALHRDRIPARYLECLSLVSTLKQR